MNVSNRQKYFQTGLVVAIFLLLSSPLPVSFFTQIDGGVVSASKPTMISVSGKVIETMTGGGYTYALVKNSGAETWVWVAMPKTRIEVGNEITCKPGMMMNNIPSSAFNRTFERIVFSQGLTSSSGVAAPPAVTQATDEATDVAKAKVKAKPIDDWKGGF
jgi:hypothetical protein